MWCRFNNIFHWGTDFLTVNKVIIKSYIQFFKHKHYFIHGGDRLAVQIMGLDGFYALPAAADDMVAEMVKAAGGRTRPTTDPIIIHQFDFWHRYGGSAQMLKIEARPSILRTYPSTSEAFSLGVNKTMFMLEKLNIAFDDDIVHSEKVGAPVENTAKSAPHTVRSPADAI